MIHANLQLVQAHQLLERLERLSADSYWAHRASGLRGSLLKCVELIETSRGKNRAMDKKNWQRLDNLLLEGYGVLENAAHEIRVREVDLG